MPAPTITILGCAAGLLSLAIVAVPVAKFRCGTAVIYATSLALALISLLCGLVQLLGRNAWGIAYVAPWSALDRRSFQDGCPFRVFYRGR